jgi:hypothetical protein
VYLALRSHAPGQKLRMFENLERTSMRVLVPTIVAGPTSTSSG